MGAWQRVPLARVTRATVPNVASDGSVVYARASCRSRACTNGIGEQPDALVTQLFLSRSGGVLPRPLRNSRISGSASLGRTGMEVTRSDATRHCAHGELLRHARPGTLEGLARTSSLRPAGGSQSGSVLEMGGDIHGRLCIFVRAKDVADSRRRDFVVAHWTEVTEPTRRRRLEWERPQGSGDDLQDGVSARRWHR